MNVITKSIEINSELLKDINKIAKENGTNEDDFLKEILNTALSKEVKKEKIDLSIEDVAEELEMKSEDLINELKESEKEFEEGKCIEMDVDEFDRRYGI